MTIYHFSGDPAVGRQRQTIVQHLVNCFFYVLPFFVVFFAFCMRAVMQPDEARSEATHV
jgi:hypothetical protein